MTNRLEQAFTGRKHPVLVTYLMAGDPDLETSIELALALQEAGADVIEFGVPFSDPIADGPTIQLAGQRALAAGTRLSKVIEAVKTLRDRGLRVPLVLMGYVNPVMRYGLDAFAKDAAAAGVDGLIVPDLPVDEAGDLIAALEANSIAPVQLVAPTSTDSRITEVSSQSRGFLYYVSLTGVTGVRDKLPDDVVERIRQVQALSKVPVAVGFGVSNPEMAKALGKAASGVVVGSAIVKCIETHGKNAAAEVRSFVTELRKALDEVELAAG